MYLKFDDLGGIGFDGGALGVSYESAAVLLSFDGHHQIGERCHAVQTNGHVIVQTRSQYFWGHNRIRPDCSLNVDVKRYFSVNNKIKLLLDDLPFILSRRRQ